MVDMIISYVQANMDKNKSSEEIMRILMSWINIFGALMKMLTDNELEFLNEVIKSLLNVLRQELMSTAAESPWNN